MFGFKGGVQVYSAFFLEALQSLYKDSRYDIFLMHDVSATNEIPYLPQTHFHFAGGYPARIRNPVFASQLIAYGLVHRPNLVISTHLNFTVAAYWLKRFAGIPYWTIAHGVEAWNIEKPTVRQALMAADRILCVSHYTRDRLLEKQLLDPNRVQILPNTFNANRFRIASKPQRLLERYGLQSHQPVILTVNRLCSTEPYKSYDKVIEALPRILAVLPDAHYIIVGKGDDRPRLEKLIDQKQLQSKITLTGFVPDEELRDYYNLCDVFAMPSKLEGFGIVYLEAMACGKPVLGGNQDGAVDALCQGKLGALVDPDSSEEIAHTLISILKKDYQNPLVYRPEALREAVLKKYGFEQFKSNLLDKLQKVT